MSKVRNFNLVTRQKKEVALKNPNDFYRTPHVLTRHLMYFLNGYNGYDLRNYVFIDSCSGLGDITKVVKEFRYKIIESDVKTGVDFRHVDYTDKVVITNPPYNQIDDFLESVFKYEFKNVILFLPFDYLSVFRRFKYFKFLKDLIIFNNKMNLTHWAGGDKIFAGAAGFCWYILGREEFNDTNKKDCFLDENNKEKNVGFVKMNSFLINGHDFVKRKGRKK